EMELVRRSQKMTQRGVPINDGERRSRLANYTDELRRISEQCAVLTGQSGFNIGSSQQLADELARRGIQVRINRDTDNPILGGNEIAKLSKRYPNEPLLQLVMEYRRAGKEITAYEQIEPDSNGRAHPSWKIHGTVSGRWSSTPNFQNLTKRQREVIG